ncbi:MAG TPA: hypothetical protein VMT89_13035, partial [Candidatus Acidoferrales bacterium]|nr:hypothetical protein [Candidatus Acidoferrales bacterium]
MRVLLSVLAWLCAATGPVHAQGKASLQLRLGASEIVRGGETALDAEVQIADGWHINAHQPNDPFLIATELKLVLPPGIANGTIRYPEPEQRSFDFAPGKKLLVHQGKIIIGTKLSVPG